MEIVCAITDLLVSGGEDDRNQTVATRRSVVGYFPTKSTSACLFDSGAPYFTTGTTPLLVSTESNGPLQQPLLRENALSAVQVTTYPHR